MILQFLVTYICALVRSRLFTPSIVLVQYLLMHGSSSLLLVCQNLVKYPSVSHQTCNQLLTSQWYVATSINKNSKYIRYLHKYLSGLLRFLNIKITRDKFIQETDEQVLTLKIVLFVTAYLIVSSFSFWQRWLWT